MAEMPFLLRRPLLLARDVLIDREHPDLGRLERIDDPRRFVWSVLPHAARTFSACIALLPKRVAEAAAVAYLYCRMLDTYEDLVVNPVERDEALRGFAQRFAGDGAAPEADPVLPDPAPAIGEHFGRDRRDASHLLLVRNARRVDLVHVGLDPAVRQLIRTLVHDMAESMRWSSATFLEQEGVLVDEEQLARYCRGVLGHPVLFASRLLHWNQTGDPRIPEAVREQAMIVGEMIQLANVTRDIEKDLRRGIAYHPVLRGDLGVTEIVPGSAVAERVRTVREALLLMALRRAPAYRPLIEYLSPRRISMARASGLLMLLFTDQYFRGCARRAGRQPWGARRGGARLILEALPAVWSRRWAGRRLAGIERAFLRAAA